MFTKSGERKVLKKPLKSSEHLKQWGWVPEGAKNAVVCEDGVQRYKVFHFGKWRVYGYQIFVKHPETEEYCDLETLSDKNQIKILEKTRKIFQDSCMGILLANMDFKNSEL